MMDTFVHLFRPVTVLIGPPATRQPQVKKRSQARLAEPRSAKANPRLQSVMSTQS